jgi:transposase
VGLTLGVVIALEVGDVARLPAAEKLASCAGTTPRVREDPDGPLRPDVNRNLKRAFVEAANAICLTRRRARRHHVSRLYERVAGRKGYPKAIGAVARHVAEARIGGWAERSPIENRSQRVHGGSARRLHEQDSAFRR